jgi:hypothetical protein
MGQVLLFLPTLLKIPSVPGAVMERFVDESLSMLNNLRRHPHAGVCVCVCVCVCVMVCV